jgi:hypothetical protein
MERKWNEFMAGPTRRGGMHVTISPRGNISVGSVTFDRWGRPDAVVLLFDEETRSIGLRPVHPNAPNAYQMNRLKLGRHRVVRAARFCNHHRIRIERTMAFSTPTIEDSVLILDMNGTVPADKRSKNNR